jgi:hypothetical protein
VPAARKNELTPQWYKLKDDPGEQKSLIEQHRDVAARFSDLLSQGIHTPLRNAWLATSEELTEDLWNQGTPRVGFRACCC